MNLSNNDPAAAPGFFIFKIPTSKILQRIPLCLEACCLPVKNVTY